MKPGKMPKWLRSLAVNGLALAGAWAVYGQSIAPLRQQEAEVIRVVADLKGRIERVQQTIAEIRAKESDAGRAEGELERLKNEVPEGQAMTLLPELMKGHFTQSGIAVAVIRLNTTVAEPEMPGFERGYWSAALRIDEAAQSVPGLLLAVADLDQQQSFVRVLDFAIQPDPEDGSRRVGLLNAAALIRK